MNWDLLIAEYNSGLEVLAAILALVIFVSSLDDLFIDLWYWTRRIFRRAKVERSSQYRQLTADMLRERTEQPLAIMVPAWQESDVIAATTAFRQSALLVGPGCGTSTRCTCGKRRTIFSASSMVGWSFG